MHANRIGKSRRAARRGMATIGRSARAAGLAVAHTDDTPARRPLENRDAARLHQHRGG